MKQYFLMVLVILIFTKCKKDDNIEDTPVLGVTNVYGIVVDANNNPISNATVTALADDNGIATTNQFGVYQINNVHTVNGKLSLMVTKQGYLKKIYNGQQQGDNTNFRIMLVIPTQATINSNTATTVSITTNAKVELPANGYVTENGTPYNGMVKINTYYANPTDPNFSLTMQGSDFQGIDNNNEQKILISYGAVSVELTDAANNPLQLANGQMATLRLKVPSTMLANAPNSIPLWYFDETSNVWKEEGVTTLINNEYVGTVSHFTWWNVDIAVSDKSRVSGTVVDCNDNPLAGITVQVGPLLVVTDSNGEYTSNVPVDTEFYISVQQQMNFGISSPPLYVMGVADGETLEIAPISLICPTNVSGTIIDCDGNAIAGANIFGYWVGGNNLTTTMADGSFSIIVLGNAPLTIAAYIVIDGIYYTDQVNINSGTNPNTTLPNDLVFCNTEPVTCSSFIINDNQGNDYTLSNVTLHSITVANNGLFNLRLLNTTDTIDIYIPDTTAGNFNISSYPDDERSLIALFPVDEPIGISTNSSWFTLNPSAGSLPIFIGGSGSIVIDVFNDQQISGHFNANTSQTIEPILAAIGYPYINDGTGTFCVDR